MSWSVAPDEVVSITLWLELSILNHCHQAFRPCVQLKKRILEDLTAQLLIVLAIQSRTAVIMQRHID